MKSCILRLRDDRLLPAFHRISFVEIGAGHVLSHSAVLFTVRPVCSMTYLAADAAVI
jgi:hypothetical protein